MVNDRQNLDLTPFAGPAGRWRGRMADLGRAGALSGGGGGHGGTRRRHRGRIRRPNWSGCWNTPRSTPPGTSGRDSDLLDPRFPVFATGRGGQLTYHGPGQRVAYVMLDLKRRQPDVRAYVAGLEEWIIRTLAAFNVRGERREDRVGVWVKRPDKGPGFEDKIAAIGVRLRRWVSFHGISINVEPDLGHFDGIVPCGVADPALRRHQPGRSRPVRDHGGCSDSRSGGLSVRCLDRGKHRCRQRGRCSAGALRFSTSPRFRFRTAVTYGATRRSSSSC